MEQEHRADKLPITAVTSGVIGKTHTVGIRYLNSERTGIRGSRLLVSRDPKRRFGCAADNRRLPRGAAAKRAVGSMSSNSRIY